MKKRLPRVFEVFVVALISVGIISFLAYENVLTNKNSTLIASSTQTEVVPNVPQTELNTTSSLDQQTQENYSDTAYVAVCNGVATNISDCQTRYAVALYFDIIKSTGVVRETYLNSGNLIKVFDNCKIQDASNWTCVENPTEKLGFADGMYFDDSQDDSNARQKSVSFLYLTSDEYQTIESKLGSQATQ